MDGWVGLSSSSLFSSSSSSSSLAAVHKKGFPFMGNCVSSSSSVGGISYAPWVHTRRRGKRRRRRRLFMGVCTMSAFTLQSRVSTVDCDPTEEKGKIKRKSSYREPICTVQYFLKLQMFFFVSGKLCFLWEYHILNLFFPEQQWVHSGGHS